MSDYKIAKLVTKHGHYKCEICDKYQMARKMYEYKGVSLVRDYIPRHFKKLCANCIYKEVYGTNFIKQKKKEGSLDN